MHAPTQQDSLTSTDLTTADPTQLTLFGPPPRRFGRPGPWATAIVAAAGTLALVYAARTLVHAWHDASGDVLDEDRFAQRSPAHAGYDG